MVQSESTLNISVENYTPNLYFVRVIRSCVRAGLIFILFMLSRSHAGYSPSDRTSVGVGDRLPARLFPSSGQVSTQPNPNHHQHEYGESKNRHRQPGGMNSQSSPVVLLHLRRLDRFFKRQGLHSIAHTYERLPARPLPSLVL